jgi:hypothetical protein
MSLEEHSNSIVPDGTAGGISRGRIIGKLTADEKGRVEVARVSAPPIIVPVHDEGEDALGDFEDKIWPRVSAEILERIDGINGSAPDWDTIEREINTGSLKVRFPNVKNGNFTEFAFYADASVWEMQVFWEN